MKRKVLLIGALFLSSVVSAQLVTMNKKCRAQNDTGTMLLKEKNYAEALTVFTAMQSSCNTKDAKEAHAAGRAEALNGLGRYDEALVASDAALKVTKGKSLAGLFQKSYAQSKLGQKENASATFQQIIALTEKNQDTKTRANNYALLASFQSRQLGNVDSANYYLEKAVALDPGNPDFAIQKGDMCLAEKKWDEAFAEYDKAVGLGKADLDMYTIRTEARMKMMQDKYSTTNAQELRGKMSKGEKTALCTELNKAIGLGMNDMKMDMFSSLVCK